MRGAGNKLRGALVAAVALVAILVLPGVASAQSPGVSPPGANDFSCKPTKGHTRPVVLVHGTFADMTISWNSLSPMLADRGYCVFALDYGNRGLGNIVKSAEELDAFVDRVLRATGARKVAIVGHSQGGMMPRQMIRFLGGSKTVAELIGLVPSNHGTDSALAPFIPGCLACKQQATGSRFLTRLNRGDETPGKRISYTQITTRYDEVVTPFRSAFLRGPKTTNIVVQDKCRSDVTDHVRILYDPVALRWVRNALHRQGRPANPRFKPRCSSLPAG